MHTVSHWLVPAKQSRIKRNKGLHSHCSKRHNFKTLEKVVTASRKNFFHTFKFINVHLFLLNVWRDIWQNSSVTKAWLSVQKCLPSLRNTLNAFRKYAEECYVPKNLCVKWLILRLKNRSDPWLTSRLKTGAVGGQNRGDFTALLLLLEFPQHVPFRGQIYDQWLTTKNCKLSSVHFQKYKYLHSNDVKTNFQAFTDRQW